MAEARRTRSTGPAAVETGVSPYMPAQQRDGARAATETVEWNLAAMTSGELQVAAAADAKVIRDLASKSKNLKGTFQRVLKNAAKSLEGIVATLAERQQSEELLRLEAENKRFRVEVGSMRTEMAKMRGAIDSLRRESRRLLLLSPPPPRGLEKIMGGIHAASSPVTSRGWGDGITRCPGRRGEDPRLEQMMGRVMS